MRQRGQESGQQKLERQEKAAAERLAQVDSQDGTDPVNEYFSELIKTDLEKRIEKMTINEWLDPECPAPWDEDYEDG